MGPEAAPRLLPTGATASWSGQVTTRTCSSRKDGLLLRDHLEDPVLVVLDVEDELAEEGLVVLLPQRLVALGEVVGFLTSILQGLDELHGVLAAAEARLDPELEEVGGLEVGLDVAVGLGTRGSIALRRATASS
jgi:hypothetical protein